MSEEEKGETLVLDEARVRKIADGILKAILSAYEGTAAGTGLGKLKALEPLNALAGVVAMIILNCDGPDGSAQDFFLEALSNNIGSRMVTVSVTKDESGVIEELIETLEKASAQAYAQTIRDRLKKADGKN